MTARRMPRGRSFAVMRPRDLMLNGADLPRGWAGKPHALTQAAAIAHGEWLCFVDADTYLAPDALASVYAKAIETRADLFSIMTRQIMETFWERAVLPLVMTALSVGFSPRKVNDPDQADAIANGQFIFIKLTVYAALEGHKTIKNSIVEDKDLALMVKSAGYRLVLADGRSAASTRMYTSLPEMWEGWTKNIYSVCAQTEGCSCWGSSEPSWPSPPPCCCRCGCWGELLSHWQARVGKAALCSLRGCPAVGLPDLLARAGIP